MENLDPQMTPEMFEELSAGGEQPPMAQQVAPQAQMGQPTQQDDVAQAREMLGVDKTDATLEAMQNQLKAMTSQKIQDTMSSKYPNIPFEVVEKQIEKMSAINPQFADSMRTTEEGMNMAYLATQASIKPTDTPDNLTDGESGGGQGENLEEMITKGDANDFDLGQYIIGK